MPNISGQKSDFNLIVTVSQDLKMNLTFVYDPNMMEMLNKNQQDALSEGEKPEEVAPMNIPNEESSPCESPSIEVVLNMEEIVVEKTDGDAVNVQSDEIVLNENDVTANVQCDKIVIKESDEILNHSVETSSEIQLNEAVDITETEKPTDTTEPSTSIETLTSAAPFQISDYVILISSDGKRIFSFASILTRNSYIFATILKKIKKSPVKINIEEFDGDTIYAALDFLNGKDDAIKHKELQLYHFAEKYSLRDLKVCFFFILTVNM